MRDCTNLDFPRVPCIKVLMEFGGVFMKYPGYTTNQALSRLNVYNVSSIWTLG
jgi:hypothetical protein